MGVEHPVQELDPTIVLPRLTAAQHEFLIMPFSPNDLLKVFQTMAKNKSPGPDGFTPQFFLAAWSIVGNDVVKGILCFFNNLLLPRMINSTAISLIPKSDCPTTMADYRPISCCTTLYKCISKLLAARMKYILPTIISPNQTAFVPKRRIGDNVMLAQALCKDYHFNDGPPRCAIKLDIHKAFVTLSWSFLFAALERMGFPHLFLK